jgi:mono/diheme cytochrome c family protein
VLFVAGQFAFAPLARADEADTRDGTRVFREKIEPVLKAHCFRCHSDDAEKLKGGLHLDSRSGMLKGGDTGPAIASGKSEESLLIRAIRHEGGLAMPPKGAKLSEEIIADFVKWVDLGAPGLPENKSDEEGALTEEARRHWAFRPAKKVAPPRVANAGWVRNPIDAFILAKLEERQWFPAPAATRGEWLRRLSFDLTGLPPAPEEIAEFESDASPDACERVVDRLLASPHFGERCAQHWLDLVRFAESEGFEYDRHLPEAWRYRDYVVESFNRDKPFDRFVLEQVAGDELAPDDRECLTASIFHRLGPVRRNAGNPEIALSRNDVLAERTDVIGTVFLGLSVGCARCHDHKLEPISQKDYYRLQAYMAATDEHNVVLATAGEQQAREERARPIQARIQELKKRAKKAIGEERARLDAQIEALEDQEPASLPTIPGIRDDFDHRTPIHVLKRGVWEKKGEVVGPRPPGVLVPQNWPELSADVTFPRTRLAMWLTDPAQTLTARVIVNRLWQHHFGAGLVKTENDFGTQGDRPSHPELLEWLAATLIENGWRLKPIHRLIVLSNAYRQSSRSPASDAAVGADPENRLLSHFSRRRLTAEEIRDAMLSVSGRLNREIGGPSVMIPVDPELVQLLYKPSQWRVTADRAEHERRSIYLIAKRNLRLPFLEAFDAPALMTSCGRRESSTHAPQALELLNGRTSNELAEAFARRLEEELGSDHALVVERAYQLALCRSPTAQEQKLSLAFLQEQPLREFALALFNLNGFLYVP